MKINTSICFYIKLLCVCVLACSCSDWEKNAKPKYRYVNRAQLMYSDNPIELLNF